MRNGLKWKVAIRLINVYGILKNSMLKCKVVHFFHHQLPPNSEDLSLP